MTLREHREKAGLTRVQLGEISGINYRLIESWEQGNRSLYEASYSRVDALAKALNINPSDFFSSN